MEGVAISFSRGSSQPRDRIDVCCIGRQILYHWATCEAHVCIYISVCVCVYVHTPFFFQILFHYRLSASLSAGHSACPQPALDTGRLGGSLTWCGSGRRGVAEEGSVLHSLQAAGAATAWGRRDCLQRGGWSALWRLGREGTEHPCLDGGLCGESLDKKSTYLNINCPKFFLLICFRQAVIRGCFQGVIPATLSLLQGWQPPSHASAKL